MSNKQNQAVLENLFEEAIERYCYKNNIDPEHFYLPLYQEQIERMVAEQINKLNELL